MKFAYIYEYHEPNFDTIKFVMISFYVLGILTSIKKENDEKSEEGTDITMSFPSGHDSDGLHYRVQGTFTRWDIILIHKFTFKCYRYRYIVFRILYENQNQNISKYQTLILHLSPPMN